MLKVSLGCAVLALVSATSGCAALTHYTDVETVNRSERGLDVLLIDAKQRAIMPSYREERASNGQVERVFRSFCAEPSPDALSALAASFNAKIDIAAKGDASGSGNLSESAANIGLRTTSIQLLRDITYRQCEGYANGGISTLGLETLQRRFQSTMVALLSIEQLTSAVRPPPVVLRGSASGTDAAAIADTSQRAENARTVARDAAETLKGKKKAADDAHTTAKNLAAKVDADKKRIDTLRSKPPATDDEKKQVADYDALAASAKSAGDAALVADAAVDAATSDVKDRNDAFASLDATRKAVLTAGGSARSDGTIGADVSGRALDKDSVIAVSSAVQKIVSETLSLGFGREVCTSIIGQQVERVSSASAGLLPKNVEATNLVLGKCLELLGSDITYYEHVNRNLDAATAVESQVARLVERCANDAKCATQSGMVAELLGKTRELRSNQAPPISGTNVPFVLRMEKNLPDIR